MKNPEKKPFFSKGKFFDSFEEMVDYRKKWPDMPLDIEWFKEEMRGIINCIELNKECNPGFTNRQAWGVLRMDTDWIREE